MKKAEEETSVVEKVTQAQATKHVSSSPIDAVIRGLAYVQGIS